MSRLLIFGYGFIGAAFAGAAASAGHSIAATIRTPQRGRELEAMGIDAVPFGNRTALANEIKAADGILVTPAPDDDGCPVFAAAHDILAEAAPKWLGYLSTTGVYGDRDGGWVFEDGALVPTSIEGRRRVTAENQWLTKGAHVFRLPGLYGHGRNLLLRLRDRSARRIHKPGHVFSRLHHDDCALGLMASLAHPRPGAIYNLCDDEPAPADRVTEWAAREFGFDLPPQVAWDDPVLSPAMRRFYRDNKRVSNALAKAELGWRPRYPSWREGLTQIFKASFTGR